MRRAVCGAERKTTTTVAALESELNKLNFGARARFSDLRRFFPPAVQTEKPTTAAAHSTAAGQEEIYFAPPRKGGIKFKFNHMRIRPAASSWE